ncbi:MAG: alanine dehydrogenase [Alphaproteobacteria bacterium 41-28]|nr:MAG: alanine dehydrogenase [Alphaproteobacteria bacterium 41-28]
MRIGVPKEIKNHEYRVGLVPSSVRELIHAGHQVIVETNAGFGVGVSDADYEAVGAMIASKPEDVFAVSDMIVKIKEPQPSEWKLLRSGQILFTYLHLAADPEQAKGLIDSGCIAIAYDTVTSPRGGLPLLMPSSEVAGRMSIQVGAHCLEKEKGGAGILLGGVPGVKPAKVTILGGGVVGTSAARTAMGFGAHVTIIDKSIYRLAELDMFFGGRLGTLYSSFETIEQCVVDSDLVIGAVLVPGAAAPKLVSEDMVKKMRKGSVLVDVAIDQGGCFETSRPTTFTHPTYIEHGIVHYCVTNMPGGVARTSAFALNNATLPFVLALAGKGYKKALLDDPYLMEGLNVYRGHITYEAVAHDLGYPYSDPKTLLRNKAA